MIQSWQQAIYVSLKLIFCIALVVGITFLAWRFNDATLMWWYLLSVFAYMAV
jgi:hypothetical protein